MFVWPLGILALVNSAFAAVTWSSTPFSPPSVPVRVFVAVVSGSGLILKQLAVRSPYLSAWLPQGAGTALNGNWPTFWDGTVRRE